MKKSRIVYILTALFFLTVSFKQGTKEEALVVSGVPDSVISARINVSRLKPAGSDINLASRACTQMQAYMDTLIIDAKSIALSKDAKAAINRHTSGGVTSFTSVIARGDASASTNKMRSSDALEIIADPDAGTFFPMGPWDSSGVPTYLEAAKDVITPQLLSFLRTSTRQKATAEKLHPLKHSVISDLTITQPGEVFITFVHGKAGHKNTIGYYTYPTNSPPKTAGEITEVHYIFPNAAQPGQGGNLEPGSKVNLGAFTPGTSIGFVLLSNAYNSSAQTIDTSGVKFYSTTSCNPEANPGLKKHIVLLAAPQHRVFISFEDDDRESPACDNKFDDVVICVTSNPVKGN